jgi:hypothetical protein
MIERYGKGIMDYETYVWVLVGKDQMFRENWIRQDIIDEVLMLY